MTQTTMGQDPTGVLVDDIEDMDHPECGSALVEYIIAAALIGLSVGLFSTWMGRQGQDQAAVVAGRQMAEQAASLARWAAVHQASIRSAMPAGTGATTAITDATYNGYLPTGRSGRNRWGQTLSLTMYRTAGDAIEGALCSAGGGRRIPEDILHQVALGAGGPGGFVSTLDLSRVQGVSGGWGGTAALNSLNAAGAGLTGGNACVSLNLSGLNQVTSALQRHACPDGTLECNTMRTDQYQGGNSLLQARDVQSVDGRIYAESADGTRKAEINAQGQVDAAGGALTQRDAVGDNPTFQVFGDVAALYDPATGQWRWRQDTTGTYTTDPYYSVTAAPVSPAPVIMNGGQPMYAATTIGTNGAGAGQVTIATVPGSSPQQSGGLAVQVGGATVASVSSGTGLAGTGQSGGRVDVDGTVAASVAIATGGRQADDTISMDSFWLGKGFDPGGLMGRLGQWGAATLSSLSVLHDVEIFGRLAAYLSGGPAPQAVASGSPGTQLGGTAVIVGNGGDIQAVGQSWGGGKIISSGGGAGLVVKTDPGMPVSTISPIPPAGLPMGVAVDASGAFTSIQNYQQFSFDGPVQVGGNVATTGSITAGSNITAPGTVTGNSGVFQNLRVYGGTQLDGGVNLTGPCGGCLPGPQGLKGEKGDKGEPGTTTVIHVYEPAPGG